MALGKNEERFGSFQGYRNNESTQQKHQYDQQNDKSKSNSKNLVTLRSESCSLWNPLVVSKTQSSSINLENAVDSNEYAAVEELLGTQCVSALELQIIYESLSQGDAPQIVAMVDTSSCEKNYVGPSECNDIVSESNSTFPGSFLEQGKIEIHGCTVSAGKNPMTTDLSSGETRDNCVGYSHHEFPDRNVPAIFRPFPLEQKVSGYSRPGLLPSRLHHLKQQSEEFPEASNSKLIPTRYQEADQERSRWESRHTAGKCDSQKNRKRRFSATEPCSLTDNFDKILHSAGSTAHQQDNYEAKETASMRIRAKPPRTNRFTWSDELHRDFVSAIFGVGLEKCTPLKIKQYMERYGANITQEQIIAILPKYRMYGKRKLDEKSSDAIALNRSERQAEVMAPNVNNEGPKLPQNLYSAVKYTSDTVGDTKNNNAFQDQKNMTGSEFVSEVQDRYPNAISVDKNRSQTSKGIVPNMLILPDLNDDEKKRPFGASIASLMGLLMALKQELELQRKKEKRQIQGACKETLQRDCNTWNDAKSFAVPEIATSFEQQRQIKGPSNTMVPLPERILHDKIYEVEPQCASVQSPLQNHLETRDCFLYDNKDQMNVGSSNASIESRTIQNNVQYNNTQNVQVAKACQPPFDPITEKINNIDEPEDKKAKTISHDENSADKTATPYHRTEDAVYVGLEAGYTTECKQTANEEIQHRLRSASLGSISIGGMFDFDEEDDRVWDFLLQ